MDLNHLKIGDLLLRVHPVMPNLVVKVIEVTENNVSVKPAVDDKRKETEETLRSLGLPVLRMPTPIWTYSKETGKEIPRDTGTYLDTINDPQSN